MLSAYRQPRRIVLKNLGGEVRSPDNGIPAGCPGATDWLALLMHLLTQPLGGIDSNIVVRAYVDDITADITGTEEVAFVGRSLAEVAVEFGRTLCLVPNQGKSCLCSTDPDVRKELKGGAFPVVDTFKDLGVIQTPCGIPNQRLAMARDQGGKDKLVRTGQVPVPFGRRCQIAAASGVPSALYGTSVQAITNARLSSLRAAATAAIWRSPGRLATEILYGLLAPFRADPLAVSIVRPWTFLADAIQREVLQLVEVQWLWTGSKGTTGPLACARVALRRAGVTADAGLTQLRSSVGDFRLWTGPSRPLQDFLLAALRAHQFQRLGKRRPLFLPISGGIDRAATLAYLC